jgi:hypothetical protein
MSLAGCLRYETYASTGVWMSHDEAVAAAEAVRDPALGRALGDVARSLLEGLPVSR